MTVLTKEPIIRKECTGPAADFWDAEYATTCGVAALDDETVAFMHAGYTGNKVRLKVYTHRPAKLTVRGTFASEAEATDQEVDYGAAANCTFSAPEGCGVLAVKTNDVAAASAVLADSWTFTSDALTQHVYVQMTTTPKHVVTMTATGCTAVDGAAAEVDVSLPYGYYDASAAAAKTLVFSAEPGMVLASVKVDGAAVALNADGATNPYYGGSTYTFTANGTSDQTLEVTFVDGVAPTADVGKGTVTYYTDDTYETETEKVAPGATVYGKVTPDAGYVAKLAIVDGAVATVDAEGKFNAAMKGEGKVEIAFVKDTAWFLDPFVRNSWTDSSITCATIQSALVDEGADTVLLGLGPGLDAGLAQYGLASVTNSIGLKISPVAKSDEALKEAALDKRFYWSRSMARLPAQYGAVLSCNGSDRGNAEGCAAVANRMFVQPYGGTWAVNAESDSYEVAMTGLETDEKVNLCPIVANGDATKFYGVDYDLGTKLYRFAVVADPDDAAKVGSVAKDACWDIAIDSGLRGMACGSFKDRDVLYLANDKKDAITVFDTATGTTNTYTACAGEYYALYVTGVADGTPHLIACDTKNKLVKVWALDEEGQFLSTQPMAEVSIDPLFAATPAGDTIRHDFAALADETRMVIATTTKPASETCLEVSVVEKKPANLTVRSIVTHADASATTNDAAIAYGATTAADAVTATEGTSFTSITADGTAVDAATLPLASYAFTPAAALDHHVLVTLKEEKPVTVTFTAAGCSATAGGAAAESPYTIYSITPAAKKKLVFTPEDDGGEPAVANTLKSVTTNGHAAAFAKGTTEPFEFTATESVELAVTYVKPYQVTWTVAGGTCDADPAKTTDAATVVGGSSNFTFTATSGKYLKSVTVDGAAVELGDQLGETSYVYESAEDDGAAHTVSVTFAPRWDVNTTIVGGEDFATVMLNQSGKAFEGDTISGTISNVKEGYTAVVYVDGVPVTVNGDGTFSGTAQKSATVAVAFAKNTAWFMNPFVRNSFVRENGLYGHVQTAAYDATRDVAAFGLSTSGYALERFSVSALTNAIGEAVEPTAAAAVAAGAGVGNAGASVAALSDRGVFVSPNGAGKVMVSPAEGVWGALGETDVASYAAEVKSASGTALTLACVAANEAGTMLYGMDNVGNLYKFSVHAGDNGKIEYFQAADAPVTGLGDGNPRGMAVAGGRVYVSPFNGGLTVVTFGGEESTTYTTAPFDAKFTGIAVTGGETPHLVLAPNSGDNLLVFALDANGLPLSTTPFKTVSKSLFANVSGSEVRWGLVAPADESRAILAHDYTDAGNHYAQFDVVEARPDVYTVRARVTDKDDEVTTTDYAYDAENGVAFTAAEHTVFTAITADGGEVDATALPKEYLFKQDGLDHHVLVTLKESAAITMSFDLQGHGDAIEPVTRLSGEAIPEPTDEPTAAGYTFRGWFTEAACANVYDFATVPTEDLTLYAKWTSDLKVNGVDVVAGAGGTGDTAWTIDGNTVKLTGNGPYVLGGTNDSSVLGFTVTTGTEEEPTEIVLKDVEFGGAAGIAPFAVAPGACALVYLQGTNELTGGAGCAAVNVPVGAALAIADVSVRPVGKSLTSTSPSVGPAADANMLIARGGANGAGIGGNDAQGCGVVTFAGGVVLAQGGGAAAGVGGGNAGAGGDVAMIGGTLFAQGDFGAQDVGRGMFESTPDESASGTTVIAGGSLIAVNYPTGGGDSTVDAAKDGEEEPVHPVLVEFGSENAGVPVEALAIRACTLDGDFHVVAAEAMEYGDNDLYLDNSGQLGLWLTNGTYCVAIKLAGADEPVLKDVTVSGGPGSAVGHLHAFTYAADDDADTIAQRCIACGHEATYTLSLTAAEVTYTGAAQANATISCTSGEWLEDPEVDTDFTPTLGYMNNVDAAASDAGNAPQASMSFKNDAYKVTATFTIKPATLTITGGVTAEGKTYDGTTAATVEVGTVTLAGVCEGDEDKVSVACDTTTEGKTPAFDSKNAGTRTVTAHFVLSGDKAANYVLADESEALTIENVEIAKKALTGITGIAVANKVYDKTTAATLDLTGLAIEGMVDGDELTVSVESAAFEDANAGNGKGVTLANLALAGADAGNYSFDLSSLTALTADITKKPVNVTAQPASVTYWASETTSFTVVKDALCEGDTWTDGTVGCNESSHSPVGTYLGAITARGFSIDDGNGGNNYAITCVPADFTVEAAALTGVSVTYVGSHVYNGAEQALVAADVTPSAAAVDGATVAFTWGTSAGAYGDDIGALTIKDAEDKTFYFKATAANHEAVEGTFTAKAEPIAISITSGSYTNWYNGTEQIWPVAVTNSGAAVAGEGWDFTNWAHPVGEATVQTAWSNTYDLVLWEGTKPCNYAFATNHGEIVILTAAVKARAKPGDAWEYQPSVEAGVKLALSDDSAPGEVQLLADFTDNAEITNATAGTVVFDLNGFTFTAKDGAPAITYESAPGATLVITNGTVAGEIASVDAEGDGDGKVTLADAITTGDFTGAATFEHLSGTNTWTAAFTGANVALKGGCFRFDQIAKAAPGYTLVRLGTTPALWEAVPESDLKALIKRVGVEAYERYADLDLALETVLGSTDVEIFAVTNDAPLTLDLGGAVLTNAIVKLGAGTLTLENGKVDTLAPAFQGDAGAIGVVDGVIVASATIKSGTVNVLATGGIWGADPTTYCAEGCVGTLGQDGWFRVTAKDDVAATTSYELEGGGTVKFHFASFEDALACVLVDYAQIELYNNLELDAPIECTDARVYVAGTESGNGGQPANRITRKAGYEGPLFAISGGAVAFTDLTVDAGGIGTAVKVDGNAIFEMSAGLVISNAVCAVDAHELTTGGFVFADASDEQVWDNVTNVWITSALGLSTDGPIPGKVGVTIDNADPAMKRLFAWLFTTPYVYPDTAPGVGFFSDEDDALQYWTGLRVGNVLMFLTQPEAPANDLTLLGRTGASLTIEGANGLEYAAVKVDGTSAETNFVACTADGAAVVLGGLEPATEYQILERVAITLETVASETHAMATTATTLRYDAAAILKWFDSEVEAAAGDSAESDVAKVEAFDTGYKVTFKADVAKSVSIPEDAADLVIDLAGHGIYGDADADVMTGIEKRNGVNVVAVADPDESLEANVTFVNSAETEATIAGADGAKGADGSDAANGGTGTSAGQGIAVAGDVQHVTITLDGFICVKGGNGGDGGDAVSGDGGAGSIGGLGIIDLMGGRQHDGLTLVVDNPAVTVKGGDGGNGGNSTFGAGGNGGAGALALNLKEAILSAGAFIGGAGGAGGTSGGEGKSGGNGGDGAGSMSINVAIDQITGGSFAGGAGGLGGKGQSGATDGADGQRGRSGQPAAPDPVEVLRVTGVSIEIGVDAYQEFKVVRAADGFEECDWQPAQEAYQSYDLGELTPSTTYVIYNRFAANDERHEPVSFVASNVVTTTAWGPEQIAAAFQDKATVTMNGTVGTLVVLEDDIDGTVTLPTGYGDITLDLNGHSITGAAGQPAISITGAACNEKFTYLAITNGADTASSLTGGDGADGAPNATTVGYDGAAGAVAVEGTGIVEFVENGGVIFVTGGNGGKGSDTNGAKAGAGGAGGAAVKLDVGLLLLDNADAVFTGGNGGAGGDALAGIEGEGGGAGGKGGTAVAVGTSGFVMYWAGTLEGGDGGDGGTTRDSSVDAMGGDGGDGGDSGVEGVGVGGDGGKGGAGYGGATIDAPNDYTGIGGKGGSGETTGKTGQNGNGSLGACPRVFGTEGADIVQDCSCDAHAHVAIASLAVHDSTYDGDAHDNATCVMTHAEEWLASDPQISYVGDNVNVGVVTAVLSTVAGDLTYAVTNCYNILPAELTDVSVEQAGELVYTGDALTAAVAASATATNDQPVTFAYCAEEDGDYGELGELSFTDAGEYVVHYKATAPNHAEATGSFTVTVKPADLTDVSVEQDGALVYTGDALTPTVTTAATAAGGQEVTFVYGLAEGEYGEAGELPAVTLPGDYTFYYKATAANHAAFESNFTVTVGVAALAGVSVAQNGTPTYTGALQTPAVTTAATAAGGQKVTFTYSYGGGEFVEDLPKFKDADEYEVAYKANARFHAEATGTFIVKIDKANLVVTANDKTIVYGEAAANDGVRFSGFRGQDNESALELGGLTFDYGDYAPGANAGEYPITPSGVEAANYEISHVAGTLTVEKTSLGGDVSVAQANALKYNGAEQFPELTITTNKYLGVLTFKWGFAKGKYGAVDEKPAITNAGEYVVYYEVSAGENTTSAEGEMTVTIGKRAVELVSGTSTNFWSGMAFTDHVVVTNGDGFAEGEGAVCTFTASIVGDVEEGGAVENAFTWELAEGTLAGNYEITTKAGEIVVKPGVVRASVDGASWVGFGTLSNAFEHVKEGGLVQLVAPYACTNALDGADGSTTETVATYAGAAVTLDLNEFAMTGTLSPAGDGALEIIGNGELELVENGVVDPSFQMREGWKKNEVTGGYEIVRDAEAGGARTTIAGEEKFYGSLGEAVAALQDLHDAGKLEGDVKIDLWQDEAVPAEALWIVDWEWPINLTIDGNGYTVYDTNRTEQALIAAGGNVVFKDVTFVGERSTGLVEFYGDAAKALFKNVTVKGYGRAAKAAGEGSSLPLIVNVDVACGVELTLDDVTIEGNDVDCVVMAGYEPDAPYDGYLPITVRVKGATRVCGNGDRNVVLASPDRLVLAGDFTGRVGVTPVAAYAGSKVGEIGGAFAVAAGSYAGAGNFVLDGDAETYGVANGAAIVWTKDATVAVTIDGVAAEVVVKTATGTPTMDLTAFVTDAKHLTRDTTIVLPNAGGDYDGLAVSAPAGWKATVTAAGGAITVTFAWDEEVVKEPKLSTNEDGQPFVKTEKGVTMGVDNAVPGFIYRLQQSADPAGPWTTVAERRATGAKVVLPWEPDVLPAEAYFQTTVNDK